MTPAIRSVSRRHFLQGIAAGSLALAVSPALAAEPIKIGFGMSLTGPNAPAGKMFLLGREIWKDEANAKGGLLGRPIEFVYYDDQSNPSLVPGIYSKLIDVDKVDLVMSAYSTNQIAPAMPIVMQKKMVYMGLFGTGVNDAFKYDRYFQILPNGPDGIRSFSLGFFETALAMPARAPTLRASGSRSSMTARSRRARPTMPRSCAPCRQRIRTSCSSHPIRRARPAWCGPCARPATCPACSAVR
jgi:branched-chain amino acid transport system substrate-binding protein